MKQLILTFFAIILCYSLFFNNDTKSPAVDEINYIYEDTYTPNVNTIISDTFNSPAFYFNSKYVYLPAKEYYTQSVVGFQN